MIRLGPNRSTLLCPACAESIVVPEVRRDGKRVAYTIGCEHCGQVCVLEYSGRRPLLRKPPSPLYRVSCTALMCGKEHDLEWKGPGSTITTCPKCHATLDWSTAVPAPAEADQEITSPPEADPAPPTPAEQYLVPCLACSSGHFVTAPPRWGCHCGGRLDWDRRVKVDRAA